MLHAQASATASRVGDLKIGAGYTGANSDYLPTRYYGPAFYVDFDFRQHFGVEGQFHFVKDFGTNEYEKTYEIGGRYLRTYGKFVPYGKLMYGRGVYNFTDLFDKNHPVIANLAYNMFAGGAGVDYKALPYLYVRGDFEYQMWNSFPPHGLSPMLVTIGAAYHFR